LNWQSRFRVAFVLTLVGFLLLSLNAAVVADSTDVSDPVVNDPFVNDPWRRTINGWEKVSDWEVPQQVDLLERIARLHPFVVASFQVLVCVGALVAFSDDEDGKSLTARQADANPEQ
ncbi:MAG: hypothetical protein ACI9G1_006067, partial [Pirellulaceae bacterium]